MIGCYNACSIGNHLLHLNWKCTRLGRVSIGLRDFEGEL